MRESSHWGNLLVGKILLCGSAVFSISSTYSVYIFVKFGSVVITQFNSSGNGVHDSGWMPSSKTSFFLKPRCDFFYKFLAPNLFKTPENPLPLVTPITSIISFYAKTVSKATSFSNKSYPKLTFYSTVPPLT